jgi:hypothetical protein
MKLTTTLNQLKLKGACSQEVGSGEGYDKLSQFLGPDYGKTTLIDILTILESNGFDDAVWSLQATVEPSDSVKRLIAADFAESVLHIFESKRPGDLRPRQAIQAARDFTNGVITAEQMKIAKRAAAAAAADADADAAAAYADAAPVYAAYAADVYAAYAADAYAAYPADTAAAAAAAAAAGVYAAYAAYAAAAYAAYAAIAYAAAADAVDAAA